MTPYKNLSSDSGVVAYELRDDAIIVRFRSGETYLYSHRKPGRAVVEKMKRLATAGKGLSSHIARNAGDRYESKR